MYRRDLRDTSADALLCEAALADNVAQARPEPDGDRIAFAITREDRTDLWVTDGDETRRLTGHGAVAMRYTHIDPKWLDWHPDGGEIVYTSPANGSLSLWAVDVETGEKRRLTHHDGDDVYPSFSPDGTEIAFTTDYPSRAALAVTSADGNRLELLRDDDYLYADPQWAGDDLYAIRTRHRDLQDRETQVVRVSRDGALDTVFAEEGVNAFAPRPRPRPDSNADELVFVHDRTGYDALYLRDSDGNESELLAEEGVEFGAPAWDGDGETLAVTAIRNGNTDIRTVTLDGKTERLTTTSGDRYFPEWHGNDVVAVVGGPTEPYHVRNCSTGARVSGGQPVGFDGRFVEPESIAYESTDGTEIHAMVYLPEGFDSREENDVPLLVHPHGGPTAYDGYDFNYRAQYFAVQGYAVIEPNYRGSSGFGRAFRDENDFSWGDGDLWDVIAAADALADAYLQVDGERAGIFGGSGGGLMTVNALGCSDRFDAGAAFYGVYDYETFMDDTDDVGWRLMKRELGYPAMDIENYRETSPIRSVPDIDAPLLVLHGEEDRRVPISQSEQLVAELETHGKRHEFQRYDGEGHGFLRRENVVDAYSRVADLFAKYLQIDPGDGTSRPHPKP
jgi:dipeptidyl aminopeptidase/acylaminoacyl peptidase